MKSRLHKIEIHNFKAFRELTLNLEGRHLLVYGPNGSGKSSLYWALHTFLQSAHKSTSDIAKYFTPTDPQNLLNIHEQNQPTPKPGEIVLTLRDAATQNDTIYRIGQTSHETRQQPLILKGDLASDFVTYRFFFGFSHFRNSEKFNLWPLFEKEILPFCVSTSGKNPLSLWQNIKHGNPNPSGASGRGGANSYDKFRKQTQEFADVLSEIVNTISDKAQEFYDNHFSSDDQTKITLKLGLIVSPSFSGTNLSNRKFTIPEIEFAIQVNGKNIPRPQSFLNEAKLTQLALSVRFAASLVNLHESSLKLLVLDDLLVSLDMSNRMKVVEILLSTIFEDYQKIILTHDYGFFREFHRKISGNHSQWNFFRLEGTPATGIKAKIEKTDLQKAEDYLHGYNLDEAALCLRKACEDTARRFTEQNKVIPTTEFVTLADALRAAKNKVLANFPTTMYETILRNTPDNHRNLLVSSDDNDLDTNTSLDPASRGRLKTNRNRLRTLVQQAHVECMRQIKLIDDILACTERVLNPAAHSGTPPLYEKEVRDALELVKKLNSTLGPLLH
jgi:ABC-type lipoprotein export system ATPase subunit